ncbi:MAG: hypothetical protein HQ472_10445 [Ignavibacteria bacterium]|nr:hypothetical protein [Ignavibacteria bacterium]
MCKERKTLEGGSVIRKNDKGRKNTRVTGYDYTKTGLYFITVVTNRRRRLFGEIQNGKMVLNALGRIVEKCILEIPWHFQNAVIDVFIIMPDHVHLLIGIKHTLTGNRRHRGSTSNPCDGTSNPRGPLQNSIGAIIGSLKSSCSRLIRRQGAFPATQIWVRGYYDVIVNSPEELNAYRRYTRNNPRKEWERRRSKK